MEPIENLTEALQRQLGIQQAQTVTGEDITADAIARINGHRGDVDRILALWNPSIDEAGVDLVANWDPAEHAQDLRQLRDILNVSFKVSQSRDGVARTFLPLAARLVNDRRAGTLYREIGQSVADGLWAGDDELVALLHAQTSAWEKAHPLGRLLAPLAKPKAIDTPNNASNLGRVFADDPELAKWRDSVVRQDWRAWHAAAQNMAPDEQLETMTSLIGLHLFVALMHRLAIEPNGERGPVFFFAAVAGQSRNPVAGRAATSFYAHWRDRADVGLRIVAQQAVQGLVDKEPSFARALETSDWTEAGLWQTLKFGKRVRKQKDKYEARLVEKLELEMSVNPTPGAGKVRELVVDTLCEVFSAGSGVTRKVKDYLRVTGATAGLVGPIDRFARKKFLLDERGLTLLARLHAKRRSEDIRSTEEDRQSVEAFLDDIFERYGLLLTLDREKARAAVHGSDSTRRLARMLPNDDALRKNRQQLELRLDALRLVRRYSDASAVIHVNE